MYTKINKHEGTTFGYPHLFHVQSELSTKARWLNTNDSPQKWLSIEKSDDWQKIEKEWLYKSRFLDKETYFKVFSKYSQVEKFELTNIYDPPMTLKEIKKFRREKRKQYSLKGTNTKTVKSVSVSNWFGRTSRQSSKLEQHAKA